MSLKSVQTFPSAFRMSCITLHYFSGLNLEAKNLLEFSPFFQNCFHVQCNPNCFKNSKQIKDLYQSGNR